MRRHGDTHTDTPGIHTPSRHTHTHTLWTQQTTNALRCCALLCCAIGIGCAIDIGIASKLMRSVVTLLLRCRRRAKRFPHSSVCLHCARQTMRCGGNFQLLQRSTRQTRRDAMRHKLSSNCLHFLCTAPRSSQQPVEPSPPPPLIYLSPWFLLLPLA